MAESSFTAPDEDLPFIDAFNAGERDAFDEIVRRHQDGITRVVRRYVRSDADAKDLAQRTFLRAIERLHTFRRESTFRAWLFRIAINVALNHVRGPIRTEDCEVEDIAAFTHSLATDKLVAAEIWRKVYARLAELPPKQRLVVELRAFHEFSFEEIAILVDSNEEATKSAFHKGVKKLRAFLPGE